MIVTRQPLPAAKTTRRKLPTLLLFSRKVHVSWSVAREFEVYISCRKFTDETIQFLADAKKEFEAGLGKAYWIALADHPSQDGVEDGKPGEAYHCLLCSFKCLIEIFF